MTNTQQITVTATTIDNCLWEITCKLRDKYGVDESYRDIQPLQWYINTGRAPVDFIRLVLAAKPFMIARKLHQGGSYDEVIARIKAYLGYSF